MTVGAAGGSESSTYVGPGGLGQTSGRPCIVASAPLAHDEMAQRRLWETSEETVGLSWP